MSLVKSNRGSDELNELLTINNLTYSPSSDLSVVASRNFERMYPQNGSSFESGATLNWIFSTSSYVKGDECWLQFSIAVKDATTTQHEYAFGTDERGSAQNIINEVIWENGDILDRAELPNLRHYNTIRYKKACDDLTSGKLTEMGHRPIDDIVKMKSSATASEYGDEYQFAIPLKYFLPSFENTSQLIPRGMIAGSQLRITLESFVTALMFVQPDPQNPIALPAGVNYRVSKPVIVLSSYTLQEASEMRLNLMGSQKPGLVMQYESYAHQQITMDTTSVSRNCASAVSHLVDVVATLRERADVSDGLKDSFTCRAFPSSGFKTNYRLGSVFYPKQSAISQQELYALAVETLSPPDMPICASFDDFLTENGIIAMTFNRSTVGGLSGVSLNQNSVSLWLDHEDAGVTNPVAVDCFAKHVRVCSTFSNGSISVNY